MANPTYQAGPRNQNVSPFNRNEVKAKAPVNLQHPGNSTAAIWRTMSPYAVFPSHVNPYIGHGIRT